MVFFFSRKDGRLIRFYCNHTAILASWEIHTNNTKLLQAYRTGFQWFNHEAQCPGTLVVCSFACVWWRQQWVQVGTLFKCGSCGTCLWFTEKERSFLLLVGGAVICASLCHVHLICIILLCGQLVNVVYIFIYAFSRHFYPKRLTVHSGYIFFVSMCSLGIEPTTFALLTQCSTTEPQEHESRIPNPSTKFSKF